MIKGVLFDFDGTLADTNHLIFESYRHTYKTLFNKSITDEFILSCYGRPLIIAFGEHHGTDMAKKMIEVYRKFNQREHDRLIKSFDGVNEGLSELKKMGLKIAIVTSKSKNMIGRGIKILGINKYFDAIITPENTEIHKPNPEPALKACEVLGLNPDKCIMVGDSIFDIMCGKAADMLSVGVSYSLTPKKELLAHNADHIINSISELPNLIDKINNK